MVARGLVLAQFPFTNHRFDRQFHTNDGSKQFLNIVIRRVTDLPWCCGRSRNRFLLIGQIVHLLPQPLSVMHSAQYTTHVGNHIIPGWYYFAVFAFTGIPGRCDVCLRTLKHRQTCDTSVESLPKIIGLRYVTSQHPLPGVAPQHQRQMVRLNLIGVDNQRCEGRTANQPTKYFFVIFTES